MNIPPPTTNNVFADAILAHITLLAAYLTANCLVQYPTTAPTPPPIPRLYLKIRDYCLI